MTFRQSSLALGAQSRVLGPADLISAGRHLLVQYGAFEQAYRDASKQFLPARRRVFEGGLYRAEALASRIAGSGNVSRPWFFAPHARKTAYQQLQAAVQSARSQQSQLARLARRAATDDSVAELKSRYLQGVGDQPRAGGCEQPGQTRQGGSFLNSEAGKSPKLKLVCRLPSSRFISKQHMWGTISTVLWRCWAEACLILAPTSIN